MPTWLSILIPLVIGLALFGDLRRNAGEGAVVFHRRRPDVAVSGDCRYPITRAQLRWYVRDACHRRGLGYAGSVADLRAGRAVGDVAEQLDLAHGRLSGRGSPLLN